MPAAVFAGNPFLEKTEKKQAPCAGFLRAGFLKKIVIWQGKLNKKVSEKVSEYKKNRNFGVFLGIAAVLFLYGMLHALGPGHGKTVISAWVMASRKKYRSVAMASALAAAFHALTAVLIVSISYMAINKAVSGEEGRIKDILQFAAGAVLLVVGISILVKVSAGHKGKNAENGKKYGDVHPVLLALGAGIVPCPSTTIMLIFSFSLGLVIEGLIFALAFAAGMAVTQMAIASGVWHLREKAEDVFTGKSAFAVTVIMPLISSVFLILAGGFILLPYAY